MHILLLIIHILVCVVLVLSILLQAGRGGGLAGGAFGGMGGSSQVFGGAGAATFLQKVTTYTALAFFLTCIGLWYTNRSAESLPRTAAERLMGEQQVPMPLGPTTPVPEAKPAEAVPAAAPADTTGP